MHLLSHATNSRTKGCLLQIAIYTLYTMQSLDEPVLAGCATYYTQYPYLGFYVIVYLYLQPRQSYSKKRNVSRQQLHIPVLSQYS